MKSLLILNGSIHGPSGNCQEVINYISKQYSKKLQIESISLKDVSLEDIKSKIFQADSFLVITGTYWESWGSPLQKFFEDVTSLEGSKYFMGKPLGAIVLSHSTGGRGVLNRILINLNLFGCLIPPMAGVELSFIAQEAKKYSKEKGLIEDVWSFKDINSVIENIMIYLNLKNNPKFLAWDIDSKDFNKKWIKK